MNTAHLASESTGGFLGVDWGSIALVCVVALVVTVVVVSLYSLGLRLLSLGTSSTTEGGATVLQRPALATVGGWACISVGALAVLYGVYLVIPIFH